MIFRCLSGYCRVCHKVLCSVHCSFCYIQQNYLASYATEWHHTSTQTMDNCVLTARQLMLKSPTHLPPAGSLRGWRQCMDRSQPAAYEPTEHATDLAGLSAEAWEAQHGGHCVDVCKSIATLNHARPWHHYSELTNHGDHVSAVCRACYFQVHQLRVVLQSDFSHVSELLSSTRQSTSRNEIKSLVHAFISCHLDYRYCNALLYRIADCQFQCRMLLRG